MTSFPVLLIYFLLTSLPISACDARNLEAHANCTSCSLSTKGMASARLDVNAAPSSSAQEMARPTPTEEIRAQNETPEGGQEVNDLDCIREEKKEEEAAAASASPGASSACSSSVVKAKSSLKVNRGGRGARAEQPGFDVDYIGPRTHPPSHN